MLDVRHRVLALVLSCPAGRPEGAPFTSNLAMLTIDVARWKQEMGFRQAHLEQFDGISEEILATRRRVARALGE